MQRGLDMRGGLMCFSVAAAIALSACSPQAQDQLARDAARSAITPVVVQRFPGVPVEPALNCVIDNANAQQISALAADSVLGPTESTSQMVTAIISKPETLACLVGEGLSNPLRAAIAEGGLMRPASIGSQSYPSAAKARQRFAAETDQRSRPGSVHCSERSPIVYSGTRSCINERPY